MYGLTALVLEVKPAVMLTRAWWISFEDLLGISNARVFGGIQPVFQQRKIFVRRLSSACISTTSQRQSRWFTIAFSESASGAMQS